ncbi:MAG: winged helix-turn-helix transcriptional regulator, partial [Cetobacterium sp.]
MNNKNILLFINNFPNITQRKLAEKLEVSLGKVNLDIKKLELEGFIYKDSGYYLTEKGKIKLKELKKQEIKTAVILAAGVSKDFIYPNGFSKIENESLVERSIKNLIEVGIEKIYIVIGYEKKYYQELAKNYSNIVLIENLNYERYSSYFSLKLLEKYLNESFILLDSDILYEKKALKKLIKSSKEDVIIVSSESGSKDECFVEITNNNLTKMSKDKSELKKIDGEMLGISKLSSRYFYEICKLDVKNPFYSYEYAIADIAKKIPLSTLKLNELVWGEVDTEEQYKKVLKNIYPRLKRNEEFEKIEEIKNILISVLDIELVDIDEIEVLGGMTNKNYLVTINKKRYVLRIPGAGTKSIINRYSEKINAKEASRIGVDKHLIYFDSETGIKISEYIENAETLNPETSKKIESIELTSELLKKLHLSD